MTFKAKEKLYYSLVDVWATLLNDREKYKAPESPLRIFFDTAFSVNSIPYRVCVQLISN